MGRFSKLGQERTRQDLGEDGRVTCHDRATGGVFKSPVSCVLCEHLEMTLKTHPCEGPGETVTSMYWHWLCCVQLIPVQRCQALSLYPFLVEETEGLVEDTCSGPVS